MRWVRGRCMSWMLACGCVGLMALVCTPRVGAQARSGSAGGASSFGSGSSMGGSSFGSGGGALGGSSFGSGGGALGGSSSGGSGSSFLSSSSGGSTALGSSGTGILGTTSSISALGTSTYQSGATGQPRAGATGTGGVSSSNPFAAYYSNPMAAGLVLSGVTSRTTFGNPLYANVNPTTTSGLGSTGLGGSRGGLGTPGLGGSGGGFPGLGSAGGYGSGGYGMGTTGVRTAPRYSASLSFAPATTAPSGLQTNLQRMISQSTSLQASRNIQVSMDGPTIVLQGWAADEHDRRLAEGMVRLTPGVHDVRNELQIATAAAPPLPAGTGQASTRP